MVELLDVVFVERNFLPRTKHQVHKLGVTGNFLLVTRLEGLNRQIGEQTLHLPIGQFTALDAGGRPDTFDGGNPAQGREAIGRKHAQSSPSAFELVNPGNQAQDFRYNLQVGSKHKPIIHPFTPIFKTIYVKDVKAGTQVEKVLTLQRNLI
jgi:hypothetical protein